MFLYFIVKNFRRWFYLSVWFVYWILMSDESFYISVWWVYFISVSGLSVLSQFLACLFLSQCLISLFYISVWRVLYLNVWRVLYLHVWRVYFIPVFTILSQRFIEMCQGDFLKRPTSTNRCGAHGNFHVRQPITRKAWQNYVELYGKTPVFVIFCIFMPPQCGGIYGCPCPYVRPEDCFRSNS